MPVKPLPLEVVRLITDQLAASIEDEQERREVGKQPALVCKDWTPLRMR